MTFTNGQFVSQEVPTFLSLTAAAAAAFAEAAISLNVTVFPSDFDYPPLSMIILFVSFPMFLQHTTTTMCA